MKIKSHILLLTVMTTLCANLSYADIWHPKKEFHIGGTHLKEITDELNPFITETGIEIINKYNHYFNLNNEISTKFALEYNLELGIYKGDELYDEKNNLKSTLQYGRLKAPYIKGGVELEWTTRYEKFALKPEIGLSLGYKLHSNNLRSNFYSEAIVGMRYDINHKYYLKMQYKKSLLNTYYYPGFFQEKAHWVEGKYNKYTLSFGFNDFKSNKVYEIEFYYKHRKEGKLKKISEYEFRYEPEMKQYGMNFSIKF